MNSSRDGACNVSDGEHLYAIGGYDGKRYLTSTERYSIETGLWNDKGVSYKFYFYSYCCDASIKHQVHFILCVKFTA